MQVVQSITGRFADTARMKRADSILMLLFASAICVMGLYSKGMGSLYMGSMALSLLIVAAAPLGVSLGCICFAYPFLSVLKLPVDVISVVTAFNLIYIVRVMLSSRIGIPIASAMWVLAISVVYQTVPMAVFGQSAGNIILFTANLLMLIGVYRAVMACRVKISMCMECFTWGVLASCFISRIVNHSNPVWMRFTGFWTDPNFLGCFCLIGIAVCLNHIVRQRRQLIWLAVLLGLAYYGFLTVSRTFVVVGTLMTLVYCMTVLKGGGSRGWLFLAVVVALAIAAIPHVERLLEARAFDNHDITNQRTHLSALLLKAVVSNPLSILFGIGYANDTGFWHAVHFKGGIMAAHNSFVDFFADFGLAGTLFAIWSAVYRWKWVRHYAVCLFSVDNMPFLVMCFYLGTLSMLKYSFLFMFLGLFIAKVSLADRARHKAETTHESKENTH